MADFFVEFIPFLVPSFFIGMILRQIVSNLISPERLIDNEKDKDYVKIPSEPVEPVTLDNVEDLYNPPQIGFKVEPVDDNDY